MNIVSAALILFFVMDPLGNIPVFSAVLSRVPAERRNSVLARELLIALAFLILFLFAGRSRSEARMEAGASDPARGLNTGCPEKPAMLSVASDTRRVPVSEHQRTATTWQSSTIGNAAEGVVFRCGAKARNSTR